MATASRTNLNAALDEQQYGKVYDHQVMMRILRYLRPQMKLVVLALGMMLLFTFTMVATPWIISYAIDGFILSGDLRGLNLVFLIFFGAVAMNYVGNYIYLRTMGKISEEMVYSMRTGMFDHIQALSIPFFDRNEVGRVMSRVQNDVDRLQRFLPMMVVTLGDILTLVGIVVAMMLMNYKLALITFVVMPFLFLVVALWRPHVRRAYVRVRKAIAAVNSGLQQNISGVRVVQSMNREDINLRRFDRLNYEHLDANLHAARLTGYLTPSVELLTALGLALVVIIGGNMVLNGTLQVGALLAFALYIQRFFDPIRSLTLHYAGFQRAMTAGTRIFELMDVQPEVVDQPNAVTLPPIKGEVRYENVLFHYVEGIPVLKNINLHIPAGHTVGLVGPTGAGKTSMISLLARFYDVTGGSITVDGHDIREVTRSSLTGQISMVLQEPFLFSTSVADNIRYKNRHATDEEVQAVAKTVGAHDFIIRLPQGYETVMDERGGNLSTGQRQLISFARAILADPHIIILDEATANIDTFTEVLIQQAMQKLLKGRTAVVIAHRLSTIQNADMIVVMNEGRIVDKGTHQELMQRCAMYQRLYTLNFEDEED